MLIRFWPKNTQIPFMQARWFGFAFSAFVVAASIFLLATRGLNFGVDFAGGTVMELKLTDTVNVTAVRAAIPFDAEVSSATETDGSQRVVIKFGEAPASRLGPGFAALSPSEQASQASNLTNELVRKSLKAKFGLADADFLRDDTVGPKVSSELFRDAIVAVTVATVLMLIYVAFRFQWQYGLGAILALVHDIIATMGFYSLTGQEFNLTSVAALLTILGYSINDSVVVFDRVREDRRKYKSMPPAQIMDMAMNSTLSRTLLTSGTTLLSVGAIWLFGGPVLKGMSSAIFFGILFGTYSSVYVASGLVLQLGMGQAKPDKELSDASA
jgi:preprotein translocase subunit SecF/SecD/SecF fusion protein